MPKGPNRHERVAQQMLRELADLIRTGLKDPRIGFVTVTDIEVSRDYSHAKVFYTLMTGVDETTQAGLTRSAGFLRSELGKRISMYSMPALTFVYDHSIEKGVALSALIESANLEHVPDDEPSHDDE